MHTSYVGSQSSNQETPRHTSYVGSQSFIQERPRNTSYVGSLSLNQDLPMHKRLMNSRAHDAMALSQITHEFPSVLSRRLQVGNVPMGFAHRGLADYGYRSRDGGEEIDVTEILDDYLHFQFPRAT
ncbi:hypothetical protein L1987_08657 [Smallanthus sonchifolius]|uniref:Uncharacterized protein n=1 Tax=Smallanthus sonchifolius TaxID=185202 RepID=A0ACB9JLB1_9ASTR|nr:hypothetical protein L1987_08657 [Smallanthus sonchifolius]